MGFRIGSNQIISIDGYPYVWNFGFGEGQVHQKTSIYNAGLGIGDTAVVFPEEPFTTSQVTGNFGFQYMYRFYSGYSGAKYSDPKFREQIAFFAPIPSYAPGTIGNTASEQLRYLPADYDLSFPNELQWHGYSFDAKAGKVVVGAPRYFGSGSPNVPGFGRVYVYNLNSSTRVFTGSNITGNISSPSTTTKFFGNAVAISEKGKYAVGAESVPGANRGAVAIYDPTASGFTESSPKYSVLIGDTNSNRFGASLAISNNKLCVGIPLQTVGAVANSGQVNIYSIDTINSDGGSTTTGNQYTSSRLATINISTAQYYDGNSDSYTNGPPSSFGECLCAHDNILAIGAPDYAEYSSVTNTWVRTGAVFLVSLVDYKIIKKIIPPPVLNLSSSISSILTQSNNPVVRIQFNNNNSYMLEVGDIVEVTGAIGTGGLSSNLNLLNGRWRVTSVSGSAPQNLNAYITLSSNYPDTFIGNQGVGGRIGTWRLLKTRTNDFGSSIAIGSGRIVIGDPYSPTASFNGGAIYIYDMSGNFIAHRTANFIEGHGNVGSMGFGHSIAIGNGKIFVSTPSYSPLNLTNANGVSYYQTIPGGVAAFTLDGGFINWGFPDVSVGNDYYNYSTTSYSWGGELYSTPSGFPRAGFGYKLGFYNDDLYSSCLGFRSQAGMVIKYQKLTRTYTPFDAVEMQKGNR